LPKNLVDEGAEFVHIGSIFQLDVNLEEEKIVRYWTTVGENIIATIKMQNNFHYPLKIVVFPIWQLQYWTFLYCSSISYCSSNFRIAKVVALNNFASFFVSVL
jgi:hypothetical protein